MVIGAPLGVLLGEHLGWRAIFVIVAALALVALAGLAFTLKKLRAPAAASLAERIAIARRPDVLATLAVTVLALAYFVMADVSVAFFLLSAVTITLYLIMYMLMYAAAIRLRYSQPELKRSYRVPGGMVGMWCIAGVGFAGVAFSFLVGFFPPTQLPVGSPTLYVALVVGGTVVFTGLPLLIGLL